MVATQYRDRPIELLTCSEPGDGLKLVKVAPDGVVKSKNGTFVIDSEGTAEMIERFSAHGVDVPIDIEHSSVHAKPGQRAEAVGWVTNMQYKPGEGLYALVQWNAEARQLIVNGTFAYLSPVLYIRKSDRRAVELHSIGMTNKPAVPGMERLVAKEEPMNGENAQLAGLLEECKKIVGLEGESKPEEILSAMLKRMKASASGEETKIASSVRSRLGLADGATAAEVVLALAARDQDRVDTAEGAAAQQRVDRYIQANKLNPKDKQAVDAALELARTNPDRLEAILANAAPIHPLGKTQAPSGRSQIILSATREYRTDESLQKSCDVGAYVSMKLRDAKLGDLTAEEAKAL